MRKETRM